MRQSRIFLSLFLGVVIGGTACSGDTPTPLEPQMPSYALTDLVSGLLLQCAPLPYSTKTVVIGPGGGTITFGPHSLVVPSGALANPVAITAEVVSGKVNSVRFQPEGLRFAAPAVLTMSYSNCSGLGMLLPKKIAYTSELLSILELLQSVDLSGQRVVVGKLNHFSRYAVAY